jgi:hypothetical protein
VSIIQVSMMEQRWWLADATDDFRSSKRSWNSCACACDCRGWVLFESARFRLAAFGEDGPEAVWCSATRSPLLLRSVVMVMFGLVCPRVFESQKSQWREDALCFGSCPSFCSSTIADSQQYSTLIAESSQ